MNQRAITVTAEAQTKVYGATDPTLTYTVGGSGLANGDTLSGLLVRTAGENVIAGGYAITQGGVTEYQQSELRDLLHRQHADRDPGDVDRRLRTAGSPRPTAMRIRPSVTQRADRW